MNLLATLDRSKITPQLCPHCSTPMYPSANGWWENSECSCWWKGAQDAVYTHQVRRDFTAEEIHQAAPDHTTAEAIISERANAAAAAKIDREFSRALRLEQASVAFLAAPDAAARATIIINHLGILNKSGKGMRKLIRRFLGEVWAGEDMETTIATCEHFRRLQITGRDPFAA